MGLNQYITVKETAELYGVSERTIQRRIAQGEFSDIKENNANHGRGGKSYLIALDCLPAAKIDLYNGNHSPAPKADIQSFTSSQRDEAYRKRNVVQEFEKYCQTLQQRQKAECFVNKYNQEHPNANITVNQLYDWRKKWNRNHDVSDLIDRRGGVNKGITAIPDDAWEYFYALYMDLRKRSVQLCYDRTYEKYHIDGEEFPSYYAFKRRADQIPNAFIIKYRYGDEAVKNEVKPYIVRNPQNLEVNEMWQSDHKLMDVFVRDENDRPCRLWLTSWMDIRSRKIVGCFLRHGDPNTDTVLHALHIGIKNTGYKPKRLYTDNGKDYLAKRGLRLDFPDSVASKLGIEKVTLAIKYNGQAKLIERYHRTIDDRFAKMYKTYAGKDAKYRPEDLKNGCIPIEDYPTIQEFETAFYNWLEDDYHNRFHHGKGMKDTPNHVYEKNLPDREYLDMSEINYIFLKCTKRKVRQNGVTVHDIEFWDEKLIPYLGQYVRVLSEYNDIQHVVIEDMDGKYICSASARQIYMYGEDLGQYEAIARERKKAAKIIRANKPKVAVNVHEEIMEKNRKTKLQEIAHDRSKETIAREGSSMKETEENMVIDNGKLIEFMNRKIANG